MLEGESNIGFFFLGIVCQIKEFLQIECNNVGCRISIIDRVVKMQNVCGILWRFPGFCNFCEVSYTDKLFVIGDYYVTSTV